MLSVSTPMPHDPIIERAWVAPGTHVSPIGVYREIDDATVADARVLVEWRGAATNEPTAGTYELQSLAPAMTS